MSSINNESVREQKSEMNDSFGANENDNVIGTDNLQDDKKIVMSAA